MPIRPSKNVVAKYLELPPGLAREVEKFAKSRGQSFKGVVVEALRRHLAYPPPVAELAPLPRVNVPRGGGKERAR
jgi:hypothetical protein